MTRLKDDAPGRVMGKVNRARRYAARTLSIAATCIAFLLHASTTHAQVSFFQPPSYAGSGDVFPADFNRDDRVDLLSTDGTLQLGNGDGTFTPGTKVLGGALAVADFNGDGKADVLQQGTGTLLVLLGIGDGTFKPTISTSSGASLTSVAATDLNGDGKADVVGFYNGLLIVYLSNGDGTFAIGVSYNTGATSNSNLQISSGDFNRDTKTDVVLITGGQEIAFLGNGDGTLQAAKISTGIVVLNATSSPFVATADFNGDGKLDLVLGMQAVCNPGCTPPVTTYFLAGKGDGTFDAPTSIFPGAGPLAVADVNGDGKWDLIIESNPTVGQVYRGNGDGTFTSASNYILNFGETYAIVSNSAIGDFNGDGKLDVAIGNAVLLGNGDATFQGIRLGVLPNAAGTLIAGGFDKSKATPGIAALSNSSVYILQNNGGGALSLAHTYALQAPSNAIATADFDGDGNLDLFVASTDPVSDLWSYSVLLGNGDGSFKVPVFFPESVQAASISVGYSIIVADFNGDHKMDIALSNIGNQSLALLMGNGDGTFAVPAYLFDAGASYLVAADFNGDGKIDIAAGGTAGTELLLGNGDGTFQAGIIPSGLGQFPAQFTADLDNDGRADLVSGSQAALGKGDGTFTVLPDLNCMVRQVADVNGDSKTDLFVEGGQPHYPQTGFLLGNGDGTFGSLINVPFSGVLPLFSIVDMDADSRPDLIVNNISGVGVMLNNTAPEFILTASALSPATVTPGNSVTSTVSVTRTFGFISAVALSCAGLPSGATCQFNPASVLNGSSTSTLTVTTSASVGSGTYALQVQGSGGAVAQAVTLSLAVQAAPDFKVDISPVSQSVTAGQNTGYMLTLTPVSGFNQAVMLSCTGAPPKASCFPASSSVTLDGSSISQVQINVTTIASSIGLPRFLPWNHFTPITTVDLAAGVCFLVAIILMIAYRQTTVPRWVFFGTALIALVGFGSEAAPQTVVALRQELLPAPIRSQ